MLLSHCVRRFRIDLCCQGMAGELTIGGLRAVREAATLRSISAAAEALGYTQSAVSRQIAAAEAAVDARLFERVSRRVVPTEAGEVLAEHANDVLGALEAAQQAVGRVRQRLEGELVLGAFPAAISVLMPRAVARLAQSNPTLRISLHDASSPALIERMRDGLLDLAVVAMARPARLRPQRPSPRRPALGSAPRRPPRRTPARAALAGHGRRPAQRTVDRRRGRFLHRADLRRLAHARGTPDRLREPELAHTPRDGRRRPRHRPDPGSRRRVGARRRHRGRCRRCDPAETHRGRDHAGGPIGRSRGSGRGAALGSRPHRAHPPATVARRFDVGDFGDMMRRSMT